MTTITSKPALVVLRGLLSEIRNQSLSGKLRDNPATGYIFSQYRKHQMTDEQLCKANEEMLYAAKAFLCYIRSTKNYQKISKEFAGKGERSVEDTAHLVGFKLPHDPK